MNTPRNQPSPEKLWKWFDPRNRQAGGWGFILNRVTALGLTFYLFLHLIILSQLAQGESAYSSFLALIHNPLFVLGELFVVIAGVYHGLNGLRIIFNSLGVGIPIQKQLLYALIAVTAIISLFFAVRMFTAG